MGLIVSNLTKKYGDRTVVDHLSFTMDQPGVYALLGTNGAGKTTSIRMMLGMLSRDEGEVYWNGAPLSTKTCNVGYLAEERGLYPKYTLIDQLMYFASLRGLDPQVAAKRIRSLSERLEVDEYLYPEEYAAKNRDGQTPAPRARKRRAKPMKAEQLSKGNQQKIQLIAALISDPELLILDEPLSGLDPVNTDLFKQVIHDEVARGKYLIMSDHQMSTIEEFCTDLTILDHSKTVLSGNLNEIKRSYGRINLFLKTEQPVTGLINEMGIRIISELAGEYHLRVSGESQANELLSRLIAQGAVIINFSLREPSLHEIFVSKAGENHEG